MSAIEEQQVAALLRSAVAAVDSAEVDADLRTEAFKVAIALLTGGSLDGNDRRRAGAQTNHQQPPADRPPTERPGADQRAPADPDDPLDQIAGFIGCKRDGLHRIFRIHNGVPQLALSTTSLPGSQRGAATDIALLLMGARQGAGVEEFTSTDVLRTETIRYGKLNETNYSKALKPLDSLVQSQGTPRRLERKLTQPGIEAARAKIDEYIEATAP